MTATLAKDSSSEALPKNTSESGEKFAAGSDGKPASAEEYKNSLVQLENELINLVLLAGQDDRMSPTPKW